MAHITLSGTLLDPTSEFAVGDKIRFTHKSTTGNTIQGAKSELTVLPSGFYHIDLQYGLVLVEYKDARSPSYQQRGVATVNDTNPATTIPELLNALVPVSSAELIEFQAILADCVTEANRSSDEADRSEDAATTAEAFAYQLTTVDLIASTATFTANTNIPTSGFTSSGDGGSGSWIQNGVTGQTPSQTPAQLGFGLLNDGNGVQWAIVIDYEITVNSLGAVSNGASEETLIFIAACKAMEALGGGIVSGVSGRSYLVDSFTIPKNVGLEGGILYNDPRDSLLLNTVPALRLKAGATITESESSSMEKWVILPDGMVFPQEPAQIALWSGTAVTIGANAHGCYNGRLTIVGFDTAIKSDAATNTEQPRCEHINFDCNSGIDIANTLDIAYITHCHGWPLASVGSFDPNPERSGRAYKFSAGGDWNKIESSFSYGYKRGLLVDGCNSVQAINCGFDNNVALTNTIGIEWIGASNRGNIVACQSAGQEIGVRVNIGASDFLNIASSHQWTNANHSILIDGGDVVINNNDAFNSNRGVTINNTSSEVTITGGSRFNLNATASIDNLANSGKLHISDDTTYINSATPVKSYNIATIASALSIALPSNLNEITISGAIDIDTITGGWPSRKVTLLFTGSLSLIAGGNILGTPIAVTNTSAVQIIQDNGGNWRRI